MIYDYVCPECSRKTERVCTVEERVTPFRCVNCSTEMVRVPSFGGGLQTEHPAWLDDNVRGAIQDPSQPKITTRTEHDSYCKKQGIAHL